MHLQIVRMEQGRGYCTLCLTYACLNRWMAQFGGEEYVTIPVCRECERQGVGFTLPAEVAPIKAANPPTWTIKRARKEEGRTAKEIGGRRTPASGAFFGNGDVINQNWMVEEKLTRRKSFSVTRAIVEKAMQQALNHGRQWVLRIKMKDAEGSSTNLDLAVLPWETAREIIDETPEQR